MADDTAFLDATAQAELVHRDELTPAELVDAAIERVERLNGELNAVIHPLFDRARARAAALGRDLPFAGVPVVVKDLDGEYEGAPLHLGTKFLRDHHYVAPRTSWLFEKLEAAGFVVIGKTNTPEFGLQPTTEPEAHGPTRNPWDTARAPGGSSGGSAAAVASGMVPVGHAGDGGGSIRIPASHCGLVGLKPSRGRVSLGPGEGESWGGMVVRLALTRTVRDTAAVLDAVAGEMPGDPYTAPPPSRPYAREVGADPGRLRIGVLVDPPNGAGTVDPAVVDAVQAAADLLVELGHDVSAAPRHLLDDEGLVAHFTNCYTAWVAADVADVHARTGVEPGPEGFEAGTWMLAEMGRAVTARQYVESHAYLQAATRRVAGWWAAGNDVLVTPVTTEPAPLLGSFAATPDNPLHGLARSSEVVPFTVPFNVTGQPAVSLPLGWSGDGLPIGVQFVAAYGREDVLLRLASQLEAAEPWGHHRPPVSA